MITTYLEIKFAKLFEGINVRVGRPDNWTVHRVGVLGSRGWSSARLSILRLRWWFEQCWAARRRRHHIARVAAVVEACKNRQEHNRQNGQWPSAAEHLQHNAVMSTYPIWKTIHSRSFAVTFNQRERAGQQKGHVYHKGEGRVKKAYILHYSWDPESPPWTPLAIYWDTCMLRSTIFWGQRLTRYQPQQMEIENFMWMRNCLKCQ